MNKKIFILVIAILMGGMTAVMAKINYVPLYIVDTQADVRTVKRSPATPLFITQDNYKLILPELEDSLTLFIYKGDESVYSKPYSSQRAIVYLPTTLVGDYEIRLCASTYYYYGLISFENHDAGGVPTETGLWENITLLGSNTSQEAILDNSMKLHVVEYNMKPNFNDEDFSILSEEDKESYLRQREEISEQRRIGLLPNELLGVFPQVVYNLQDGSVGINYLDLIPVLFSCIQELKVQLDTRTEKIVDVMMSRGTGPSAVREVRNAIGNTLLSVAPTSMSEPARARYLLSDDATDAYLTITDMGGRLMKKVPVSPSDTEVLIDSGILGEGIYLCTLLVNGVNAGTKRLIKTK